jgi:hypothetical protein
MAPTRRRLPRWAKFLLWAAAALAAVFAAGVLWFMAMISGGFDDLFNSAGPFEGDTRVVVARDRTHQINDAELRQIVEGPVRAATGTRPSIVATARSNWCETGQHDWKRDDSYDLRCGLGDAVLIVGDKDSFREDMVTLHDALITDGTWTPDSHLTLPSVMTDYWDERVNMTRNRSRPYTVTDLPPVTYAGVGHATRLSFDWSDGAAPSVRLPSFTDSVQWQTPAGLPLMPVEVDALITDPQRYGLVIELERDYFDE